MEIEELNKLKNSLRMHYIIGAVITLAIIVLSYVILEEEFELGYIVMLCFFGFMITTLSSRKKNMAYKKAFKNYFVKSSLEEIFTDMQYEPEKGIPYSVLNSTGMIFTGDRYGSEDYIHGKYKNIPFEQSDVTIEVRHMTSDGDGHMREEYVTIFKGRWMIFDFNKEFKANIQVVQKGFESAKSTNNLFGKKEEKYKKVKMESESFNKRFYVRAQSEHEAFYILTPSLMEKIQKLDSQNRGKLLFCFVNNKLHIALDNRKDSFEPGNVFKKINEEEIREKILNDTKIITQFVDELNLDNDLFKK